MVEIEIDMRAETAKIARQLGALSDQAPKVLARAINDTAKDARKQLATKAQETYDVKRAKFNKALKLKRANTGNLTAQLKASGSPMPLSYFKVSPAGIARGANRPDVITGHVLQKSGMKALQMGNIKAFVAAFSSGHIGVMQRRGAARLPVRQFMSPSEPQMLGSEEFVWAVVKPDINDELAKNIEHEIAKLLVKKA